MVSGVNLQTLKDSGEYPCSVCRKGVGSNSIYCAGCSHWVHKKCNGVIGSLNRTLITIVSDAKVLLVQLTGDLIMNGFLCKIKNWMLLIHSATLEIRSVLGGGCDLSIYYKNSICVGQVPGTLANINLTCPSIHHTWANIQHVYPHCLVVCR